MVLEAGRLIKVEFEMRLPVAATPDEVDAWVAFGLGAGSMPLDNPLSEHDMEFWRDRPLLTDTGMTGRVEESGHRTNPDGSMTCRVRHIREAV